MSDRAAPDVDTFEFPCSFAQQRVWLDDRLSGGSAFYNIHASLQLSASLNAQTLREALDALVARHETLRTTFVEREGVPKQRVASRGGCDLAAEDLRTLQPTEAHTRVLAMAHEQAALPFDLSAGPLLRVRLLRLPVAGSVLMITIHHIVADAWSMGVLLRDLTALYEAAARGQRAELPELPELPIQYADYSVWQRDAEASAGNDADLVYWCSQLQCLPTLQLPTDGPRPAAASHRGRTLHFDLDVPLSQQVLAFARRQSLTPYSVLLAALAVVLQRQAGQDEVVVGMPVAGRDRPELEGLVGFFVNTLVLRIPLHDEPSFAELAQRVRRVLNEALTHASVPFERLVEALKPQRDLSRNPLFQISVQYLAAPGVAASSPGAAASVLDVQRGSANFDLSFDFWLADGGLRGRLDYATDLFAEASVRRLVEQLRRVLAQALADPEAGVEGLDLLSAAERRQLAVEWAGGTVAYPRDLNLAACWAAVVQRSPQARAISARGVQWNYRQLDERASRHAAALAARGAASGDRIGIAMARGAEQVAGLIAIVRLGCAYVALDAAWPQARLAGCMAAAGVGHVLCDDADDARWVPESVRVVRAGDAPRGEFEAPPPMEIDPLAPAYIAFTSGSTGAPKGVVVPHRAVLRLACGNPQVPLTCDDRMLVYAPLAFDASTLEIWGPLTQGACLCIPPPGPLGLDEVARWIANERISVAWLTAGLFHQLAAGHAATLAGIERLFAGGDVLSSEAVRRVLTVGSGRNRVFNGYGPTENTTFTCVHEMSSAADAESPVPIGRPIANGFVRVVDARGRLVPLGVPGELLAGGDGLALGYLADPALTADRFVADPLESAARVYRTGDRVRWRDDGTLEFLGRVDRQLKVRGYRVEPGEIEAALRALPGVADAHVLARADGSGDKRLVAYVAAPPDAAPAALLRQLGSRLPAWMVPTELHVRVALQLNDNGKIDEAALDASDAVDAPPAGEPAAIDGEVEELVAQVWADVLARPVTDARAGFFAELAGHSLMATQAVARLNAALGIELPLAAIFEEPTVRGLARRVESLLVADLERGTA